MISINTPLNQNDHHLGPLHALVSIIEYADFECLNSSHFSLIIQQLLKEFGSSICYAFRHFPLSDIHPNALLAASAAEAAKQQNEFWNMSRLLFDNYDCLSDELYLECAEGLNLNIHRFRKDMKSPEVLEKITKDYSAGVRSGVYLTPTIILNNIRYDGQTRYDFLKNIISRLLAEGQATYI